jgi:hypothetical protein
MPEEMRADAEFPGSIREKRLVCPGPRQPPAAVLGMAFAEEQFNIGKGDDPLLYFERQSYLLALHSGESDLETARVVLAKARQRLPRRR